MPFAANVPVVFGDVTVLPGDYAYADRGGAVFIPGAHVGRVMQAAADIEVDEGRMVEEIRTEDPEAISEVRMSER